MKTSVYKLVFASLRGHIYMLGFKHARNEKLKFHLAHFLFKYARMALYVRKKKKKKKRIATQAYTHPFVMRTN